jgi:hypothetical protein
VNTSGPVESDPVKASVDPSGDSFRKPAGGTTASLNLEADSGTLSTLLGSKAADQMEPSLQKKSLPPCKAGDESIHGCQYYSTVIGLCPNL